MKRGKHPTNPKRKKPQRRKKLYMELREELQVEGVIPVEPEGAIRNERVDPASQSEQPLPNLIGQAIRNGWAVPEEKKPRLVDELVAITINPEIEVTQKVAAYNALTKGDQIQYERDHPQDAKPGTTVNVGVAVSMSPFEMYKKLAEEVEIDEVEDKIDAVQAPNKPRIEEDPSVRPGAMAGGEVLPGTEGVH